MAFASAGRLPLWLALAAAAVLSVVTVDAISWPERYIIMAARAAKGSLAVKKGDHRHHSSDKPGGDRN